MNQYKLRFISLGGIVGVTKNMYVYELYESKSERTSNVPGVRNQKPESVQDQYILKDILIVDCGIGFPHEKELGVDFVIPDISYLKDKTDKIRAVILSHAHEDHTSALPYHYEALGRPPVYTSKLTETFVKNKFREFGTQVKIESVRYDSEYHFGDFTVSFIRMTHSVPDTMHILIKTPVGAMYHGTDFKLDCTPPYGPPPDFYAITKAGKDGILCLLSDCLGAEREGLTLSERIVGQTFEDEMRKTKGKFIMTTFSSNISRIRQCVEAAIKFNRKIVFMGRSMRENTGLANEIGYLPIPHALMGKEEEVSKIPPNKICLIMAGSQGQYGSALTKVAGQQNKNVRIKPGDKVIFSSDPIPGNENEVYGLIEELMEQGADVKYSDIVDQLHASGHGNKEDLKFLIRFTNPQYYIPIGGTVRQQKQYQNIVEELGEEKNNVLILKEGETVWFSKGKAHEGEVIETKNMYVDAYGIGDVGNVILRDRKTLSSEGMVVAMIGIGNNGVLAMKPQFVSRGFVYDKDESGLFEKAGRLVEDLLKPRGGSTIDNITLVRKSLVNRLEDFFFKEKGRKPLVVVELITI